MRNIRKHQQIIILFVFLIINFIVKVIFLSSNSLGNDEPFSVYVAQMSIPSIIKLLYEGNNPPLYEILLHFWIKLFGISEFSVRFPSLIFSCITVLFIYRCGVSFFNNRVAIYASIFFVFSNYHIFFAHEARAYALLGMFTVISVYYFLKLFEIDDNKTKKQKISNFISLLATNILLIYSHYFGFFILIAQFIFLIIHKQILSIYWKYLISGIAILTLLYLPNIIVFTKRLNSSFFDGAWVNPPNGFESIYNMLWSFSNKPIVTVIVITIFILAAVRYFIHLRKAERLTISASFVSFSFLFIFLFMFFVSYFIPIFLDRYLMPASILFCILLASAADSFFADRKYLRYLTPVIICILFIVTVDPNVSNKRNVRETVEKVKELKNSNTLVLISPPHFLLNFTYYYDIDVFEDYDDKDIYTNINRSLHSENIYGINNILEVNLLKWNRIVFLGEAADISYPDNNIKKELDANFRLMNIYEFYEIFKVYEYEQTDLSLPRSSIH